MENNECKTVSVKNRRYYYFDDIIKIEDFDFHNMLFDEKSYKNIVIYDILYKNLIGEKPLRIIFDKVNEYIGVYDGTKYLILFDREKYDAISNRTGYLMSQKMVLHIFFLIIMQKSKLIHMILYL